MRTALLIDQGNTRTKCAVWGLCSGRAVRVAPERAVDASDFEELLSLCERHAVRAAAWCSVTHIDARVCESLRQSLGGRLLVLTGETPLPFGLNAQIRPSLGADCVASLCGARALHPSGTIMVGDAGTCLTLDVLPDHGPVTGDISPGIKMRLTSMHERTAALPLIEKNGPLPPFGTDTDTAMRCGAVRGMAAEIAGAFARARADYDARRLLLTGGDASIIYPLLSDTAGEISHDPDLVAIGLLNILKHNEYL